MKGYLRKDGRKGIRNVVAVAYLVECAHHVSRLIVQKSGADDVHLIGFPGCYPNKYALEMMKRLCTHPNVGAVLLVSLGCESFNREELRRTIVASGRPVDLLVIQQSGGTTRTLNAGLERVAKMRAELATQVPVPMGLNELVVGTVCGGSDGTSGITANPAVGRCFDWLIENDAACIFEETGELIGCERIMASRAVTPELGREIEACVNKAADYYRIMGYGSFAPGNAEGGLTTLEEKSMGA
jgi:altronate hydrolase